MTCDLTVTNYSKIKQPEAAVAIPICTIWASSTTLYLRGQFHNAKAGDPWCTSISNFNTIRPCNAQLTLKFQSQSLVLQCSLQVSDMLLHSKVINPLNVTC